MAITKKTKPPPEPEKPKMGRPAPPIPKMSRTLNLDLEVWAFLDASGNRSEAANAILRAAMLSARKPSRRK